MTKAQKFYNKSKRISNQVWDIMAAQAVAFANGEPLNTSYNSSDLELLVESLEELRHDILVTYKKVPKSLDDYYCAISKMVDDIRSGSLLLH